MCEGILLAGEDNFLAIIPTDFFRGWLSWVNSPVDQVRPTKLDNSSFFCEHGLLALDPNCPTDIHMTATIICQRDWELLEKM